MFNTANALEHRTRKQIFRFIQTNPGSTLSMIKRVLDLNRSTLSYHLNFLEKNNEIFSKKEGRTRRYYCSNESGTLSLLPNVDPEALTTVQRRLLAYIERYPGITQKELMRRTKKNQQTVSYNVKKLIELQLVWKVETGGRNGYELVTPDKLREEMKKRLLLWLMNGEIDKETYIEMKERMDSLY
jgi:predicted transcriptional regulator